jgi:L-ascorbate metabolism protein UlaG (beta-lactamase superfamily)
MSTEEIMQDVDLVIVSHLHSDHFDPVAQELLPKNLPLICQPCDEATILEKGFADVTPLEKTIIWKGIEITYKEGNHGSGKWLEHMGQVMGFILRAENEPIIYWAGDTIWYGAVQQTIEQEQPDIIVIHSSGALFVENSPIVMDIEQTLAVCRSAAKAKVIVAHMEALDHGTVSRDSLRHAASAAKIEKERLLIPMDGEILNF